MQTNGSKSASSQKEEVKKGNFMPRGLNRSGDFRKGTPITLPHTFGNPVDLTIKDFGNKVDWSPSPDHFGNAVTWQTPNPAHFGNTIGPTAPAPTIDRLNVKSGLPTGGDQVIVIGAGFVDGATVLFGAGPATDVVVTSSSQIACVSPAGTVNSTVDVKVTNPDTQSATLSNAFSYANSYLRQSDSVSTSAGTGTSFSSSFFETDRYAFAPIQAGDGLALIFTISHLGERTDIRDMNITSITDNCGNTWTQIPSARNSQGGFFTQFLDIWVTYDIAPLPPDSQLQITVNVDTVVGPDIQSCFSVWDCVGLTGDSPVVETGSVTVSGGGFTSPSIDGGARSIYINSSVYPTSTFGAAVAVPFVQYESESDGGETGQLPNQLAASAADSGVQAPVWSGLSDGLTLVLSEVALPATA